MMDWLLLTGRDATRAFVSGDFTEKGLVDDTDGLSHDDLIGIFPAPSFHPFPLFAFVYIHLHSIFIALKRGAAFLNFG